MQTRPSIPEYGDGGRKTRVPQLARYAFQFNLENAVATTKTTKHTKGQKVATTGLFIILTELTPDKSDTGNWLRRDRTG